MIQGTGRLSEEEEEGVTGPNHPETAWKEKKELGEHSLRWNSIVANSVLPVS